MDLTPRLHRRLLWGLGAHGDGCLLAEKFGRSTLCLVLKLFLSQCLGASASYKNSPQPAPSDHLLQEGRPKEESIVMQIMGRGGGCLNVFL